MSEHTPGPWKHDGQGCYIFDANNQAVAEVRGWGHLSVTLGEERAADVQVANGNLIAAAPDLLAACEAAVKLLDALPFGAYEGPNRIGEIAELTQLRAAISKARPEPAKET